MELRRDHKAGGPAGGIDGGERRGNAKRG